MAVSVRHLSNSYPERGALYSASLLAAPASSGLVQLRVFVQVDLKGFLQLPSCGGIGLEALR